MRATSYASFIQYTGIGYRIICILGLVLVKRPLHLNETGQWGAALQVRDLDGKEVACVAFSFGSNMPPQ